MKLTSNPGLIPDQPACSSLLLYFKDRVQDKNRVKCYLSGPISNYTDLNLPAFEKMEKVLYEYSYPSLNLCIVNPLKLIPPDQQAGKNWEDFMKIDLRELLPAHFVVMLPNWKDSYGAVWEVLNAKILKIPVFDHELKPIILPLCEINLLINKSIVKILENENELTEFFNK